MKMTSLAVCILTIKMGKDYGGQLGNRLYQPTRDGNGPVDQGSLPVTHDL